MNNCTECEKLKNAIDRAIDMRYVHARLRFLDPAIRINDGIVSVDSIKECVESYANGQGFINCKLLLRYEDGFCWAVCYMEIPLKPALGTRAHYLRGVINSKQTLFQRIRSWFDSYKTPFYLEIS